jgi:hypothetical protein
MGEPVEYRVTPALGRGAMRYQLDGGALIVESAKTKERRSIALADVASVRLTHIQGIGRCELHTRGGDKFVIPSRSVRGIGDFVDQRDGYLRFVRALHAELGAAGTQARFLGGTSFGFALGVLAVIAGLGGTLLMALADGGIRSVAPITGALALGLPLALAGRARPYRPDALPEKHLP